MVSTTVKWKLPSDPSDDFATQQDTDPLDETFTADTPKRIPSDTAGENPANGSVTMKPGTLKSNSGARQAWADHKQPIQEVQTLIDNSNNNSNNSNNNNSDDSGISVAPHTPISHRRSSSERPLTPCSSDQPYIPSFNSDSNHAVHVDSIHTSTSPGRSSNSSPSQFAKAMKSRGHRRSRSSSCRPQTGVFTFSDVDIVSDIISDLEDEHLHNRCDSSFDTGSMSDSSLSRLIDRTRSREHIWTQMFKRLTRSVDNLYIMCEYESNLMRCEEAVQILSMAQHDFEMLLHRLQVQSEIQVESSFEESRPKGMAWDVRKMSPKRTDDDRIMDDPLDQIILSPSRDSKDNEHSSFNGDEDKDDESGTDTNRSPTPNRSSRQLGLSLHQKFSSPDRQRKNAIETKRKVEERQVKAQSKREELEQQKVLGVREHLDKAKVLREKQAIKKMEKQTFIDTKLDKAERHHELQLKKKIEKAKTENTKADEIAFITMLETENKKLSLEKRLQDTQTRRSQMIQQLSRQRQIDWSQRMEKIQERRKQQEMETRNKLLNSQQKREDAEHRRTERLLEIKKKSVDDTARMISASERRKAAEMSKQMKSSEKDLHEREKRLSHLMLSPSDKKKHNRRTESFGNLSSSLNRKFEDIKDSLRVDAEKLNRHMAARMKRDEPAVDSQLTLLDNPELLCRSDLDNLSIERPEDSDVVEYSSDSDSISNSNTVHPSTAPGMNSITVTSATGDGKQIITGVSGIESKVGSLPELPAFSADGIGSPRINSLDQPPIPSPHPSPKSISMRSPVHSSSVSKLNRSSIDSSVTASSDLEGALDGLDGSKPVSQLHWCRFCYETCCELEIDSHLNSNKHESILARTDPSDPDISNPLILLPDEPVAAEKRLLKERERLIKKRATIIKNRLIANARLHEQACGSVEYPSPNKPRLSKLMTDLEKQVQRKDPDPDAIENLLRDILKVFESKREADMHVWRQLRGIPVLVDLCSNVIGNQLLAKVSIFVVKLLSVLCNSVHNRTYMLLTNRLVPLVDLMVWCLEKEDLSSSGISFLPQLFHILTLHIKHRIAPADRAMKDDFIAYVVCCRLLPKMKERFSAIRGPLDLSSSLPLLLLKSISFVQALTAFPDSDVTKKPVYDRSEKVGSTVTAALRDTDLVGIVSLLISILLSGGPPRSSAPRLIPQTVLTLALISIKALNNIARIDLDLLQNTLGSIDFQVEVFHLLNYLVNYCTVRIDNSEDIRELLNEMVVLIGYYVLKNNKNQELVSRGEGPTLLQKLCSLPFQYFVDGSSKDILFPTLVVACFDNPRNKNILQQEMNIDLLIKYISTQQILAETEAANPKDPWREEEEDVCSVVSTTSSKGTLCDPTISPFLSFAHRFPRDLWKEAVDFFSSVDVVDSVTPVMGSVEVNQL